MNIDVLKKWVIIAFGPEQSSNNNSTFELFIEQNNAKYANDNTFTSNSMTID